MQPIRVTSSEDGSSIEVRAPFALKDITSEAARSCAGKWDTTSKLWRVPLSAANAERLVGLFREVPGYILRVDDVVERLASESEQVRRSSNAAKYGEGDDVPPVPVSATDAWEHQRRAFWFAKDLDAAMLAMDMGEQPADAKILTPDGWQNFGDTDVGDEVIGVDGLPTRVEEVKEWVDRELVRVHLADGGVVPCSMNHLWTVRSSNGSWVTVPLSVVEATLGDKRWARLDKLPRLSAIESKEADLPLDPYVLGVILAEGSTAGDRLRFRADNAAIVQEVRGRGYTVRSDAEGRYHNITGATPKPLLTTLGLAGLRSAEKHVPRRYLEASARQRLDLLHGLMDGDGSTSGGSAYFTSVSERLARDVSVLARSLGGAGSVWPCGRKTVNGHTEWRVTVGLPKTTPAFGVSDKEHKRSRDGHRRIIRVEHTGTVVPMRCIRVANDDGLYVTNDYVVTHNTGKSKVTVDLLTNNDARLVLVLAPSSVVDVWPREFAAHAGEPWLVAALSKGTVAKRLELAKGLIASSAGQRVAIVINYEGVIQKAFKEWALTVAWDYLVLDESHRLKSPTGVTSKYAAKLGRISKRRLALTGTPFPQTLLDIFGQFRVLDPSIYGMTYTRFKARYGIWGGFNQHELKGYTNEDELREKYHSISFRVESDDVLDLPPITDQERTGRLEGEQSRVYADLRYDFHSWIDEAQTEEVTATNALVKLLRLQQVTGGSTTNDEGELVVVGDLKRRLLLDFLSDLPKAEPVVVFARFRHDLDVIEAVAEEMGRAYGEVSGRRKDLEEARMPPWCNLLGVQMQSGGVGIDLTRARYAVYYSLGFSLAEYLQSRKRLHRPGQTRHVSVTHLIAEGTVDEKVYAALAERKEVVETILRENRDTDED